MHVKPSMIKVKGSAYGFLNVAYVKGDDMWSMEVVSNENGTDDDIHKIPAGSDDADISLFTLKSLQTHELGRV